MQYTEPLLSTTLVRMVVIGVRLQALRKAQGLSYRRLAERVGISYNGLAAYEKDREMPSFLNVVKLCRYFDVPLEYFITGKEKPFEYRDIDLVDLFAEVDRLPESDRGLVKSYAQRIVAHAKEGEQLTREADDPSADAKADQDR